MPWLSKSHFLTLSVTADYFASSEVYTPVFSRIPRCPQNLCSPILPTTTQGQALNLDAACAKVNAMLAWRRENNVDEIRNNIVSGGMDCPTKFPHADIILKYAYQIVITTDVLDFKKNTVSYESYDFNPKEVMKIISVQDYLKFLAYTLEYKALVLEQLSEERERAFLMEHNNDPPPTSGGYGVIVQVNIIRDLTGFGLRHMTSEAKAVLGEGLKIGSSRTLLRTISYRTDILPLISPTPALSIALQA